MSKKEMIVGCVVALATTGLLYYLVSQPTKPKTEEPKPAAEEPDAAPQIEERPAPA